MVRPFTEVEKQQPRPVGGNATLTERLATAHADARGIYGVPRLHAGMRRGGADCERCIDRLM
ncbi:hypothetical protein QOM21_36680 [Streptomyces sp. Pv4-95]|uniref:hypothetical protein n=1 Tax=Streptomyces sp. Pv4-95 TaxID=3049543 RepID=UPI00389279A5